MIDEGDPEMTDTSERKADTPAGQIDLRDPEQRARGRDADAPHEIPVQGWKDVAKRVYVEAKADNLTLIAAGIAFYALLSLAPAMAAAISVYGLVVSPEDVARQLNELTGTMPEEARTLISEQLNEVVNTSSASLSIGLIVGLVLSLWGASAAMRSLMVALSTVYDEEESRGFVKLRGSALVMTLAGLVFLGVTVMLLTVGPSWVENNGNEPLGLAVAILRWPVLAALMVFGLGVLYRYAPDRDQPKWRWTSWGAAIATALWLLASIGFSLYAGNFGSYNKTYGSMAAVIILMLWLYITALCVLVGAEVNAELEHQTAKDSTRGPDRRPGDRDAYVADTVGPPA